MHLLLVDLQVKCPSLVKSLPPGQTVRSNAPGVAQGGGGMVTLGIDRYIMTSENVKQDQTTKDSGAAFFNNESRGLLLGKHEWSLIGFVSIYRLE